MKIFLIGALALGVISGARAYDLKNLSQQDILTLGAGLDELPRKRGDADNLIGRLQQQISEQDAKAAADARAAQEAAMRKKIEAEKSAPTLAAPLPPVEKAPQ